MFSASSIISKWQTWSTALLFTLVLLLVIPSTKCIAQYDDDYISYGDFYQSLAPYGQWIEDPQYGYVWSPDMDEEFRPYYTNGHWAMTEYGNTWVSDYPWGWAAFHYGRWTYDGYYGWLWIPGNYWGPSWVNWRSGDGFYGWAPLGPDYNQSMSLTSYSCPEDWWVFIPPQYLYSDHYYQYWYGPRDNGRIIGNTVIINNTYVNSNVTYVTGPHIAQVRQVTGKPVQVYKVRNSRNLNTRVHNDVVRMYRPAEIRQAPRVGSEPTLPPNVMVAPQPIKRGQPAGNNPEAVPPFRSVIIEARNSRTAPTPGTNINQTAEPQRNQSTDNNPYEWDVNRHVKQEYTPPARTTRTQNENTGRTTRQAPTGRTQQQPAPQREVIIRKPAPKQEAAPSSGRESSPTPTNTTPKPGRR